MEYNVVDVDYNKQVDHRVACTLVVSVASGVGEEKDADNSYEANAA